MHILNPNLYVYSSKTEQQSYDSLEKISKLTKETSSLGLSTLRNDRNFILAYPDTILQSLPIFCANYVLQNRFFIKDIFIFSVDNNEKIELNPAKTLVRNLSTIAEKRDFLYTQAVPCLFNANDETVSIEGDFSLIRNIESRKQVYYSLANQLSQRQKPAIIIAGKRFSRIPETIRGVHYRDEYLEKPFQLNIGLYIFENFDQLVYSKSSLEDFVKWYDLLNKDEVRFIFHFSNPYNRFIKDVAIATNSLLFHYGSNFMKKTIEHFRYGTDSNEKSSELINSYNIDNPSNYETQLSLVALNPIPNYNLDDRLEKCIKIIKILKNQTNVVQDKNFRSLEWIVYQFKNLAIRLSLMKVLFKPYQKENGYLHLHIKSFLEELLENSLTENEYFKELIIAINSLCDDFSSVRTIETDRKSSPITKSYAILDFSIKLLQIGLELLQLDEIDQFEKYLTDKYFERIDSSDKKEEYGVIIAVFSPFEKKILLNSLKRYVDSKTGKEYLLQKIKIYSLNQLSRKRLKPNNQDLVLAGPLPIKYFGEYFRGYDNIFILSYEGTNHKTAMEHVSLVEEVKQDDERKVSFEYLIELLKFNQSEIPIYVKEYLERSGKISIEKLLEEKEEEQRYSRIRELILREERFRFSKQEIKEYTSSEEIKRSLIDSPEDEQFDYQLKLKDISTDSTDVSYQVKEHWTYLCIKDKEQMKLEEFSPEFIDIGDYIILLEENIRKNFIDFIINTFDLETDIDVELINSWKESLSNYFLTENIQADKLYDLYCNECEKTNQNPKVFSTFLNWIHGNVSSTRDAEDLLILGKIIEDEFLAANYNLIHVEVKKLWAIRSIIGKKISIIIKEMLNDKFKLERLSFEEMRLFDKIKICEVIEKNILS